MSSSDYDSVPPNFGTPPGPDFAPPPDSDIPEEYGYTPQALEPDQDYPPPNPQAYPGGYQPGYPPAPPVSQYGQQAHPQPGIQPAYPPPSGQPLYPQPGVQPAYPQPGVPYGQPVVTGYSQQFGAYPGAGYPEYPSYPPAPDPYAPPYIVGYNPTAKNGFGIASLILGISTFCCLGPLAGILAVVFGVMGRNAADEGRATNKSLATVGIVLGIVGTIVVTFIWILGILPWY